MLVRVISGSGMGASDVRGVRYHRQLPASMSVAREESSESHDFGERRAGAARNATWQRDRIERDVQRERIGPGGGHGFSSGRSSPISGRAGLRRGAGTRRRSAPRRAAASAPQAPVRSSWSRNAGRRRPAAARPARRRAATAVAPRRGARRGPRPSRPSKGPGAKARTGASPSSAAAARQGLRPERGQGALEPALREVDRRPGGGRGAPRSIADRVCCPKTATCSRSSPTVPQKRVTPRSTRPPFDLPGPRARRPPRRAAGSTGRRARPSVAPAVPATTTCSARRRSTPPCRSANASKRVRRRDGGEQPPPGRGSPRSSCGRTLDQPDEPGAGHEVDERVEVEQRRAPRGAAEAPGRARTRGPAKARRAARQDLPSAQRIPRRHPDADAREAAVLRADAHQVRRCRAAGASSGRSPAPRRPRRRPARRAGAPRSSTPRGSLA